MKAYIFGKFLYINLCVVLFINNNVQICFSFNLTVLHNNDFHSHFEPINTYSSECKTDEQCFGGVARTVSKVKEIKDQSSNVLFLNAGDHYQGTIWYAFKKWEVVAKFVKLMKHNAMALGNHEFDDGVDGLMPFIQNVSYNNQSDDYLPILSCNIDTSNEPKLKDLIKPSIVKQIDGRNIAIIGYTTPETVFLSRPGKTLKFNDEIDSIKSEIQRLNRDYGESLNIFIAVGHSGFEKDKEIAQKIPDLDIVVGGHTNTFLYTGTPPSIEIPENKYPVVFDHGMYGKTLVVQAFYCGKYLGKLDVVFDDNGKVIDYGGNPILLDNNTLEDSETLIQVNEMKIEIDQQFGKVMGSSLVQLSSSECKYKECNLGNVIADAFVSHYIESTRKIGMSWTSAPIALINGGSIRTSISSGNITMKDIMSAFPFDNKVGILKINGSMIWWILERSVYHYKKGRFMQVSGLRVVYDLNKPSGYRLQKVRVRCAHCLIPHYEDLDFSKTYAIVITEFLVFGGNNYKNIDPTDFSNGGIPYYDVFSEYIKKYSPIFTGLEDRIILNYGSSEIPNLGANLHIINRLVSNSLVFISICAYLIGYRQQF